MVLTISNSEYRQVRNGEKSLTLSRDTTDNGVLRYIVNSGFPTCWQKKVRQWGAKEDVSPCVACGKLHSKHSPPQCFSCAMGMN